MTAPEPLRSPGRPRGGDSDCRDRLLAAAMTAFAGSGYEGASLRAIALAAGFDVSMVAHYFGSKAELWLAVVDEAAGRMRDAHAEIAAELYAPGVSAAQRLRQGVEFLFDQIASDPRLASLVLREVTGEGERAVCVEERLILKTSVTPPRSHDRPASGVVSVVR